MKAALRPGLRSGLRSGLRIKRRTFLKLAAAFGASAAVPALAARPRLAFAPAAFEADTNSALIWIATEAAAEVLVEYSLSAEGKDAKRSRPLPLTAATDFVATTMLTGLQPGSEYHYRVLAADGDELFKGGRFRTAPAGGAKFTVAFTGDMEASYQPFSLLDTIAAAHPHLFLHLGDTVYADHPKKDFAPSVRHYRYKHAENRKDKPLQRLLSRCTTFAIWDDHEVANNFHATHPNLAEGMQVFREYWPVKGADADALYRCVSWGGCDFIILDTRRFKSSQAAAEDADKTMLGAKQKAWFKRVLKESKAAFKFVITSVPFHGGGSDTWGNYTTERDEIAAFIRDEKIAGVVLLSADYHMARDWSNAKTGLKEFMVGPIATKTQFQMNPDARQRHEKSGKFFYDGFNFGLLDIDTTASPAVAKLRVVNLEGKTLFDTAL